MDPYLTIKEKKERTSSANWRCISLVTTSDDITFTATSVPRHLALYTLPYLRNTAPYL